MYGDSGCFTSRLNLNFDAAPKERGSCQRASGSGAMPPVKVLFRWESGLVVEEAGKAVALNWTSSVVGIQREI